MKTIILLRISIITVYSQNWESNVTSSNFVKTKAQRGAGAYYYKLTSDSFKFCCFSQTSATYYSSAVYSYSITKSQYYEGNSVTNCPCSWHIFLLYQGNIKFNHINVSETTLTGWDILLAHGSDSSSLMNTYLNNKLDIVHRVDSYHEVIEKTNFVKCQKVSNSYGMFLGNSHLKDCFVLDCHFPRLQYWSSYSVTLENTFFFNTTFDSPTSIETKNDRPHTFKLK